MGDPKKQKKKYSTPSHPWQEDRLREEKKLVDGYSLKNKKEIWKAASVVKKFKIEAKKIIARPTLQSEREEKQLLDKLTRLKILPKESKVEDILNMTTRSILDRRLQTLVAKKDLARTPAQARQFIVHGHITINGGRVSVPSYLVSEEEEGTISFMANSPLSNPEHPEKVVEKKEKSKEVKPKKKVTDRAEKPVDLPLEEKTEEVSLEKEIDEAVEEPMQEEKIEVIENAE